MDMHGKFDRIGPTLVFLPDHSWRAIWDVVSLMLIAGLCVVEPLNLSVEEWSAEGLLGPAWEYGCLTFFSLDLLLNFNTAYEEWEGSDTVVITSRRRIAARYLKGWFWLDLVATIPFDLVLSVNGMELFRVAKAGKLLRVLRLLRITKAPEIADQALAATMKMFDLDLMGFSFPAMLALFCARVIASIGFLSHLLACVLMSIVDADGMGWRCASVCGPWKRYGIAMVWTATALLSGTFDSDLTGLARQSGGHVLKMFFVVLHIVLWAVVVACVAKIAMITSSTSEFNMKRQLLMHFLMRHEVGKPMRTKVNHYLWQVRKQSADKSLYGLIDQLSAPLKKDVLYSIHRPAIDSFHLFRQGPFMCTQQQFAHEVCLHIRIRLFAQFEFFITQGFVPEGLFYIRQGSVRWFVMDLGHEEHVELLGPGRHVGMEALFLPETRAAALCSALTEVVCETMVLTRSAMDCILQTRPDWWEFINLVRRTASDSAIELMQMPTHGVPLTVEQSFWEVQATRNMPASPKKFRVPTESEADEDDPAAVLELEKDVRRMSLQIEQVVDRQGKLLEHVGLLNPT
mmetsp:Transcript_56708/g.130383  ORF Transcript_56708/g.130383 Transcript_56708/m.130383 type:complete len:571 (+) Transcript_56708:1460-3172(+)